MARFCHWNKNNSLNEQGRDILSVEELILKHYSFFSFPYMYHRSNFKTVTNHDKRAKCSLVSILATINMSLLAVLQL